MGSLHYCQAPPQWRQQACARWHQQPFARWHQHQFSWPSGSVPANCCLSSFQPSPNSLRKDTWRLVGDSQGAPGRAARLQSLLPTARRALSLQEGNGRAVAGTSTLPENEAPPAVMEGQGGRAWSVEDGAALYNIDGWGAPYFLANSEGHVAIRPTGSDSGEDEVDLFELVESLRRRKIKLPMIIRFPDIVQHRMRQLQDCFDAAIKCYGYEAHFQGVFPVKCNHDRYLVEDILEYGRQFRFGLEAGSKPELLIAIANLHRSDDSLLICNGYKDRVYVESVLLARKLSVNAVIVLEQMDELALVLETSRKLKVRPVLGVRAKLSTKHGGHWGSTSGERGKFGLTVNEIVHVVYALRQAGMLGCLQLLHFHIGSQIPAILIIKEAMREASHMYCELALMGAPMGFIDVGGGLGIDYDGTKSQSVASTNYSMQNYANDVVAALLDACLMKGVPQPVVVSESGRALASHHSVLVFDVLSAKCHSEEKAERDLRVLAENAAGDLGIPPGPGAVRARGPEEGEGLPLGGLRSLARHKGAQRGAGEYLLSTFHQVYDTIDESNFQEAYNDARQFKMEAGALFKLGCLSLEQRAQADALHEAVCHKVLSQGRRQPKGPAAASEELAALSRSMAAVYHVNLSVFRSVPDAWAIDQVFPVMPLQRLGERPTVDATLADLTCDSDGKIDRFIKGTGEGAAVSSVLPLHELPAEGAGSPYYLGLFLAGVYQEVMGSLHNLFGGLNVVHVRTRARDAGSGSGSDGNGACAATESAEGHRRGSYTIEHVVKGQTMEDVLRTVEHVGEDMMEALRCEAEDAVAEGLLSLEESQKLLRNYQKSLGSYTYLSK